MPAWLRAMLARGFFSRIQRNVSVFKKKKKKKKTSRFYNVKKLEYFRFPLATARKDDSVFMCTEGHVFWKELCQNGGVVG